MLAGWGGAVLSATHTSFSISRRSFSLSLGDGKHDKSQGIKAHLSVIRSRGRLSLYLLALCIYRLSVSTGSLYLKTLLSSALTLYCR